MEKAREIKMISRAFFVKAVKAEKFPAGFIRYSLRYCFLDPPPITCCAVFERVEGGNRQVHSKNDQDDGGDGLDDAPGVGSLELCDDGLDQGTDRDDQHEDHGDVEQFV